MIIVFEYDLTLFVSFLKLFKTVIWIVLGYIYSKYTM